MNERLIVVETGHFDTEGGQRTPSYQIFERLTNSTWRLAKTLPDGGDNEPMYFRDARRRMADMSRVKAYGGKEDYEEE